MNNSNDSHTEKNISHETSVEQDTDNSLYFTQYFSQAGKNNVINFHQELKGIKINSEFSGNKSDLDNINTLDENHHHNPHNDCIESIVEDMHLALTEVTHELDLRQIDVLFFNLVLRPVTLLSFLMLFGYLFIQAMHSQEIRADMWMILMVWFYLCQKIPAGINFISQLFRPKVRALVKKQKKLQKLIKQWENKQISESAFREQANIFNTQDYQI